MKTVRPLTEQMSDPRFCPKCWHLLDAFTCISGEHRPGPGDYTVCINCASVLRWNDAMDFELSALMEVPIEIRFQFARLVETVKTINGDG